MHAELTVSHRNGNLIASLQGHLGGHNLLAVQTSIVLAGQPDLQAEVEYAIQRPTYRLLCWQNSPIEFQAFVEPVGQGDIKTASQTVWDVIRALGGPLNPQLARLELTDETIGRPLLVGATGFGARLGRRETLTAILIGGVSLVFLLVGAFTFAKHDRGSILNGAAPALVAALLAVAWALSDVLRGRLAWRG